MEELYNGRRYLGEQRNPREYEKVSRRVREGVQGRGQRTKMTGAERRRKRIQSRTTKGVYGKITIWLGEKKV